MSTSPGPGVPEQAASRDAPPAPSLAAFLHERDVLCPACRYNLRNLSINSCPECGRALSLHVNVGAPRFLGLLVTLAPLTAYVGFTSATAVALFATLVSTGFAHPDVPGRIWLLLLLGAGDALALARLYRKRTVFLSLRPETQAALALAMWLLHLGVTLWTLLDPI